MSKRATILVTVAGLEIGTHDCWGSIATQTILTAFGMVVDQFRGQNPNIIFFVAQITPLNPSGCRNPPPS